MYGQSFMFELIHFLLIQFFEYFALGCVSRLELWTWLFSLQRLSSRFFEGIPQHIEEECHYNRQNQSQIHQYIMCLSMFIRMRLIASKIIIWLNGYAWIPIEKINRRSFLREAELTRFLKFKRMWQCSFKITEHTRRRFLFCKVKVRLWDHNSNS